MKKPTKATFPDKWSNQPLYFRQWTLQEVPGAFLNHIDKKTDDEIRTFYGYNFTDKEIRQVRKYQNDNWYLHNICEPMNLDKDTLFVKIRIHGLPYINKKKLVYALAEGFTIEEIKDDCKKMYIDRLKHLGFSDLDITPICKYRYNNPIEFFMPDRDETFDLIIDRQTYQMQLLSNPYSNEEMIFEDVLEEIKRELTQDELELFRPMSKFNFCIVHEPRKDNE